MDEDPPYLQPGFDPNSLKVAELRGLLLEHDVNYLPTAKKAALVDLFNEHIATHSRSILNARGRVSASSRGIVDVNRYGDPLELDVPPPLVPRRTAPRRSTRGQSSTGSALEDDDIGGTITISPVKSRKTPGRNASPSKKRNASPTKRASGRASKIMDESSDAHAEEEDVQIPEPPTTVKKTRRKSGTSRVSLAAPTLMSPPPPLAPQTPAATIYKQEEESDDGKSPFSNDNPFQRGSPMHTVRSAAKENRRKTLPKSSLTAADRTGLASARRSTSNNRRQTDFPLPARTPEVDYYDSTAYDTVVASKRQHQADPYYDSDHRHDEYSPERAIKKEEIDDEEEDPLQPGEEFTPEAALELERAQQESGAIARRARRAGRRNSPAPASLLWVVLATVLSAYFIWWRKEKIEIGYCSVGKTPPKGIHNHHHDHIPQPISELLLPECENCPQHATCKPNFIAECKDDYVLTPHPFSLFGLVPLPPTCEPDTEKLRRIAILSDEAIKVLRKRAADVECGEVPPANKEGVVGKDGTVVVGKTGGGPIAQGKGVDEDELKKILYDLKAPKLSDEQFNELWRNALEDVAGREEVEVGNDSTTKNNKSLVLASSSMAMIPLTCSIRLSVLATLTHYRPQLVGLVLLLGLGAYVRRRLEKGRARRKLVERYAIVALRMLARAAEEAGGPGGGGGGGGGGVMGEEGTLADVPVVQLRDRLLQHEFDPRKREEIWKGVREVVELNSNVRAAQVEIRGERFKCWTWIGGRLRGGEGEERVGGGGGGLIAGGGGGAGAAGAGIEDVARWRSVGDGAALVRGAEGGWERQPVGVKREEAEEHEKPKRRGFLGRVIA